MGPIGVASHAIRIFVCPNGAARAVLPTVAITTLWRKDYMQRCRAAADATIRARVLHDQGAHSNAYATTMRDQLQEAGGKGCVRIAACSKACSSS